MAQPAGVSLGLPPFAANDFVRSTEAGGFGPILCGWRDEVTDGTSGFVRRPTRLPVGGRLGTGDLVDQFQVSDCRQCPRRDAISQGCISATLQPCAQVPGTWLGDLQPIQLECDRRNVHARIGPIRAPGTFVGRQRGLRLRLTCRDDDHKGGEVTTGHPPKSAAGAVRANHRPSLTPIRLRAQPTMPPVLCRADPGC